MQMHKCVGLLLAVLFSSIFLSSNFVCTTITNQVIYEFPFQQQYNVTIDVEIHGSNYPGGTIYIIFYGGFEGPGTVKVFIDYIDYKFDWDDKYYRLYISIYLNPGDTRKYIGETTYIIPSDASVGSHAFEYIVFYDVIMGNETIGNGTVTKSLSFQVKSKPSFFIWLSAVNYIIAALSIAMLGAAVILYRRIRTR